MCYDIKTTSFMCYIHVHVHVMVNWVIRLHVHVHLLCTCTCTCYEDNIHVHVQCTCKCTHVQLYIHVHVHVHACTLYMCVMNIIWVSPDFTVKLWDLFHGVLIHTFAVHGGGVKNIVTCPPEINVHTVHVLCTCICTCIHIVYTVYTCIHVCMYAYSIHVH